MDRIANPARRKAFKVIACATGLYSFGALSGKAFASEFWSLPRSLVLRRPVTDELVKATYFADGHLVQSEYQRLCHILRDVQANQSTEMSIGLLNILCGVQGFFRAHGQDRIIDITSGLRTPATNGRTEGAARNSLHQTGNAADIRIAGVPSDYLGRLGKYLEGGGVGIYPSRNFTHVDDGRVRSWRG